MARSRAKIEGSKVGVFDAITTALLAIVLCAAMEIFLRSGLQNELWRPVVHGLSQDGAIYLSLNQEGIRLHNAETGVEIDQCSFSGPLANDPAHFHSVVEVLHPMELAAPEGGEWDAGSYGGNFDGLGYSRARIKISPSKRFVVATFPAGYFLLWDRTANHLQVHAEPKHLFTAVTLDELQNRLLIEAIPRSEERLIVSSSSLGQKEQDLENEPSSAQVLVYQLDRLEQLDVVSVKDAGRRIGDDKNLRLLYDEKAEDYRVMHCDDFPYGSERVIMRFNPRQTWRDDDPAFFARRISDKRVVVADFRKAPLEMLCSTDATGSKSKWELPKAASDRSWLECGAVTLGDETKTGMLVTTWDEEKSFAVFELPKHDIDTSLEAVILQTASGERRVRLAGLEGYVADLPIGKSGEITARSMYFWAESAWPKSALGCATGAGVIWSLFAAKLGRIRSHGAWLVLAQWLLSVAAIFVIDGLLARAPLAMLAFTAFLFLQIGIVLLSGLRCALEFSARPALVCVVAVITIVILGQAASAQLPTQPTWNGGGGGCCTFGCWGGGS